MVLQRGGTGDFAHILDPDPLLTQRVEQQPVHVVAKAFHVRSGAGGEQRRSRRIHFLAGCRGARSDPSLGIRAASKGSALHQGRLIHQCLIQTAALVDVAGHEHERALRLGPIEQLFELFDRLDGGVTLALRDHEVLGLHHHHDAPRRQHRHRPHGVDERADAVEQLVAGGHVHAVEALDIERTNPFLDELGECLGERRLFDLVLAQEQIDRIGTPGGNLLSNRRNGQERHAVSRIQGASCLGDFVTQSTRFITVL